MDKDYTIEYKRVAHLTSENIDDIMADALEGGITYWCGKAEVVGDYLGEYASEQISRGGTLILYDIEDENIKLELTLEKFLTGYKQALELELFDGDLENDYDSTVADVIVQLALFGDVVYG